MFAAKSFMIGNKAFCVVIVNDDVYLDGKNVNSLQTLQKELLTKAEKTRDATMVRDILSFCSRRRVGNIPNCS